MAGAARLGRVILILAYWTPVPASALDIPVTPADVPIPFPNGSETSSRRLLLYRRSGAVYEADPGTR